MFDVFASSREGTQHGLVDAFNVGDAVDDRSPRDAESTGEFVAEMRLVDVAGGERVRVEMPGVEGAPSAVVGAADHVGHNDVGVEVRVGGTARAVTEGCSDEPVGRHLLGPVVTSTGHGGVSFEVTDRGIDSTVVGGGDLVGHLRRAEREG